MKSNLCKTLTFMLFYLLLGIVAYAQQSPGGISADLRIWLKPDNGFTPSQWNDHSGNNNHYTQLNASRQPFVATEQYSFNPVIDFGLSTDATAKFMSLSALVSPTKKAPYSKDNANSTIFSIILNRGISTYHDIIGFGNSTPYAAVVQANSPVMTTLYAQQALYPRTTTTGLPSIKIDKLYLSESSYKFNIQGITYGLNGETNTVAQTLNGVEPGFASGSILGSQVETRNGYIGEVIAYERELTDGEKNQVRSYLAIKYGLTLPHNYISSKDNTIIWDVLNNSGYNTNIAGIGTDNESSTLLQKQGKSVNSGEQVVISTTGLSNSNAENGIALSESQFLLWGDNGLTKAPSVLIADISGINARFGAVWKVQNTSSVGTVRVAWPAGLKSLTLLQSNESTFATSASITASPMTGNTATINGVAYNYADVTLEDGSFFTFGAEMAGPGGVFTNLRIWLRPDMGFTPQQWQDFSSSGNHYTQTNATRQPFTADKYYNFNPVIDFGTSAGADARFMVLPNGKPFVTDFTNASFFAIALNRDNTIFRDIIGFGNSTTGTALVNSDLPALTTDTDGAIRLYPSQLSNLTSTINKLDLRDVSFTNAITGTTQINYGLNGTPNIINRTFLSTELKFNSGSILGSQLNSPRNGLIGEVVGYEEGLSEIQKQQIRSYLGLKYGITLNHNYLSSAGTVVWDRITNTGYNLNIAGLGTDNTNSALLQKQSQSINDGEQVIISTSGLANLNVDNQVPLSEGQFLLWGDNGLAKSPSIPLTGVVGITSRFAAVWKVQNTSSVGKVRVAWPAGMSHLYLLQSSDYTFATVDAATNMTSDSISINGKLYNFADVTFTDGQYFTFATRSTGPGGITGNLRIWLRSDIGFAPEKWNDQSQSDNSYTQTFPNRQPFTATQLYNFNPAIDFGGSTDASSRFMVVPAGKPYTVDATNSSIFSVVLNRDDINYRDMIGFGVTTQLAALSDANLPAFTTGGSGGIQLYPATATSVAAPSQTSKVNVLDIRDVSFTRAASAFPVKYGINGVGQTVSYLITNDYLKFNSGSILGAQGISPTNGLIGEMIAYERDLDDTEKLHVRSYLAIKYGITLAHNYVSSDGLVTSWNILDNTGYNFNIAGIGKDTITLLDQKQSNSVNPNTNGQLIIGLGATIAASNAEVTALIEQNQFLLWGDNNNTQSLTVASTPFAYAGDLTKGKRMNRIWKYQNTNIDQETLIRFPKNSVGTTSFTDDNCSEYVFISADDEGFTSNVKTIELTENGSDYEAKYTFPNGSGYFTFGKISKVDIGVAHLATVFEQTIQHHDKCGSSEWTYFNKTDDLTKLLLGTSNLTPTQLANISVKITPQGAAYNSASIQSKLMPRVSTVIDGSNSEYGGVKVRVYYSETERVNSIVPTPEKQGWYKYNGDAQAVIDEITAQGQFTPGNAVELIPDVSGIQDGVNYVEFHGITSFSSFVYYSTTSVLPVKLIDFTAKNEGAEGVSLNWRTSLEMKNEGFDVERSANSKDWKSIGFVASKSETGNSSIVNQYSLRDLKPIAGLNYYRLKQIDLDQSYQYSRTIVVNNDSEYDLFLYPNPVFKDKLNIATSSTDKYEVQLFNVSGQEVLSRKVENNALDVAGLAPGIYVLKLKFKNGLTQSKTFIIK